MNRIERVEKLGRLLANHNEVLRKQFKTLDMAAAILTMQSEKYDYAIVRGPNGTAHLSETERKTLYECESCTKLVSERAMLNVDGICSNICEACFLKHTIKGQKS